MKTLYIDVFFLINLTVDIISLYFASIFSKTPTTTRRLLLSAILGALTAVGVVFLPEISLLKLICGALGLLLMALITPKCVTKKRKAKFALAFLVFESLVGGTISLVWNIFDKYITDFFDSTWGGAVNRKMLFLSLIVLLCIGVFKMLVSFFSNVESEGSAELEISFLGQITTISAFVDSGNFAKDPMDLSPVILIKKELAKTILPENIINLTDIDRLERAVKKRIRLIPITRGEATHVLVGVKADAVRIKNKGNYEELRVTLAIDKEGGSYGGYLALMPSAALDNALVKN